MVVTPNSKIALFPGCSLEGSAGNFAQSLQHVLGALGVATHPLREWSCCGATSAHALDPALHLELGLRNLALAEAQGFDEILAPCAACYHRLAGANHELLGDAPLLARLNQRTGLAYEGKVTVRNILDLLANRVDPQTIAARVTRPLTGLTVACYYGCLNTRVPRMEPFDTRDDPQSMDRLVRLLGAATIDWSYKTECCGASLFITSEATSARLVGKILQDAAARGAGAIAVACPMCQNNLDTKQDEIRAAHGLPRPLPVPFITQLMGLAFGMSDKDVGLEMNFVPMRVG